MQQPQHQLTRSHQARNQALAIQRAQQARQLRTRPASAAAPGQFYPQGAQQLDVAGCGQGGWNQGGYPSPAGSPDPWMAQQYFEGLPALAPAPFPGELRNYLYRLGMLAQTTANGVRTVEVAPESGASLYVSGILSLNDPFQVLIHEIKQGSIGWSPVSEIDASTFNTDECFCPIELGCANNLTPLVVSFSAIGSPSVQPFLNMVFVGTFSAGWGTCGVPYGPGFSTPLPTMPGSIP